MSYIGTDQIQNAPVFRFKCRMAGKGLPKNLFTNFDEELENPSVDAIRVFLRLKPTTNKDDIIQVLDSKTVLFKMPQAYTQSRKKLNIPDQYKYTFSSIFSSNATQGEIFTGCVANHLRDLFGGQHCLLFTYGTTNAGKTYTVLGTADKPGIIPRTLTTVFKSIKGKEYGNAKIKPHLFNSALDITEQTLEEDMAFKQKIINWNADKTQSELSRAHTTAASSVDDIVGESVFREMQKRLTNDTTIVDYVAEPEERFSIWVSFAEIYNEAIFDLLQPVTNGKRKQLKLSQDSHKNTFIRDLKHVYVETEEEAFKVLMFGKNNLQVAATDMNSRSSRSHCIFTIKLLKCPNEEHPERVTVSSFSICDLAGAERQKKTLNVGMRLKESQNINCSLHVLSRCFSIIRENQLGNENKLIPFRDSKLTQLFQHALLGKESVTMVVNVNPDQQLCEETQHVLKASAIAKHIVVQPRVVQRPPRVTRTSIFSQIISKHNRSTLIQWDSCVKPKAPTDVQSQNVEVVMTIPENESTKREQNELEQKQETYENLLVLIESLQEKLQAEKVKHVEMKKAWRKKEDEIREEMRVELENMLENVKQQHQIDIKRTQELVQTEGERVIDPNKCLQSKKAKIITNDEGRDSDLSFYVEEMKEEIEMQRKRIDGLTDLVNILKEEKKELTMDLTSAKMKLGWKDRDIESLNNKLKAFEDESELHAAYLTLEKEMASKCRIRDNLLEEARSELLEEISTRMDLEAEVEKLEKELSDKEEAYQLLQSEVDDLTHELSVKRDTVTMLNNRIDEIEMDFDIDLKRLEAQCSKLENKVAEKDVQIEKLTQELIVKEEQLYKRIEDFKAYEEEVSRKFESLSHSHEQEKVKMAQESESEISTLEQSLKQQILENTRLQEMRKEKEKACEQLGEELIMARTVIDELNQALRKKDYELESSQNKLMGFELSIPALEAEFNRQRKENFEHKKKCEDQKATILNMEHDLSSFKANQKEIIGKYEEQLRKTKEENETLKKEVARVTSAFYKSTPTPKKDLEKQVQQLKRELEEAKKQMEEGAYEIQSKEETKKPLEEANITHLRSQEHKESTFSKPRFDPDGANKENERLSEVCLSVQSEKSRCEQPVEGMSEYTEKYQCSQLRGCSNMSKSAKKITPPRRVRRNISATDISHDTEPREKPQRQAQIQRKTSKKLWAADSVDRSCVQLDDEVDLSVPQDSPTTYIKRNLRARNK